MNHDFFSHGPQTDEKRSHKAARIGKWVVLGLCLATLFALLFGFLVTWLWNALMPEIFGLGTIGYWQAVGLVILAKLLFGGGEHHGPPRRFKAWHHHKSNARAGGEYAPIPPIPEEQQESYARYWEERGKAAFKTYVQEQLEQNRSDKA